MARVPHLRSGVSRRATQFQRGDIMATGETGFDDVTYDLVSVQYHCNTTP